VGPPSSSSCWLGGAGVGCVEIGEPGEVDAAAGEGVASPALATDTGSAGCSRLTAGDCEVDEGSSCGSSSML
jgi:hypothetical protein